MSFDNTFVGSKGVKTPPFHRAIRSAALPAALPGTPMKVDANVSTVSSRRTAKAWA